MSTNQSKYFVGEKVGASIVPLCSLTAIPLHITNIKHIHGDQVAVEGHAIIFGKYSYASIPQDLSMELSLAAIDVSRLLPQVERYTKPNDTVLVVGCGKVLHSLHSSMNTTPLS